MTGKQITKTQWTMLKTAYNRGGFHASHYDKGRDTAAKGLVKRGLVKLNTKTYKYELTTKGNEVMKLLK